MRKDFNPHSVAAVMATCDMWAGHCPARAEHRELVFLASFLGFPGVASSVRLYNMHLLSCNLAQDNQS